MAAQTTDTYNNSGGTWSQTGDKQYPAEVEPKPQGKKPALQALAATGTAVFSGIIDNNSVGEYNPDFFWRDKVLIYDEMMRSDGIIAGVRRAIEQPLLSADWTIVPGCVDDSLERKYGQQQPAQQPQGDASQPYPMQQQQAHMFADPAMLQGQPPSGMHPMQQPGMMPMPPQQPQRVPAAQPTKRDIEIAAFVQSNLFDDLCYTTGSGQTLYQSWQEVLRHALLHLWYGFAVFEKVWKVEDGFVKLARLTPLLPQTLYRWWVDDSTELVGIQQYVWKAYGYRYINIPVAKLMRFANQQEGNNFEGVSFLRAAYKHWYYATEFEKIQAIGIQRDAVNFPVINVPGDASDADIQAAQALVQNIRAGDAMGATAPPGFTVEFPANHQPFTDVVQTAIVAHHESIARSMMAPFLVQGDTRFGGKSTDESQGTRFLQGLQHCADYVCDIFNQAIRELVDYNYDDVDVYPKLQCSRLSAQDLGALADAVQKLMAGNTPLLHPTPSDEDFWREQLGIPDAPSNPVEAMNPGSPANAMQPDAGVNPLAGSGDNQSNTNMTPHGASGASADAGGDAGGGGDGMSELSDNVRLLAETFNAIMGVDAVSRGQEHREQAVRLYNPYHRGTGAGGGQFTRKGTAGASAPSAGRSSGGSSSRSGSGRARGGSGGGASGNGASERASGSSGSGRSRGGGGGSGGSSGSSRGSRSSAKSEGENTAKSSRGEKAYQKWKAEVEANRAELNGVHGEQAMARHMALLQMHPGYASRYGKEQGLNVGHTKGDTTTRASRSTGSASKGSRTKSTEETAAKSARGEKAYQKWRADYERTTEAVREQSRTGESTPHNRDLAHKMELEASPHFQRYMRDEHSIDVTYVRPRAKGETPKVTDYFKPVGAHTTKSESETTTTRASRSTGTTSKGSRSSSSSKAEGETTSRGASSRRSSSKAPKSDEEMNGGHHVMTESERAAAGLKAEVKPGGKLEVETPTPIGKFNVYATGSAHVDQVAHGYGEHQLGAALHQFTRAELVTAARQYGLKANGSKEDLVARITQHVTEGRYSGRFPKTEATGKASSGGKGSTRSSKSSTDDEIARLEARLATLKAGRGTGESTGSKGGKATTRGSKAESEPQLKAPTSALPHKEIEAWGQGKYDASRPMNPWFVHRVYGSSQLHTAINREPMAVLRQSARLMTSHLASQGVKIKITGRTHDALVKAITDATLAHPQQPFDIVTAGGE